MHVKLLNFQKNWAEFLSQKLKEVFPMLAAFIATHPNSYRINSLSVVLGVLSYLSKTQGVSLSLIQPGAIVGGDLLLEDSKVILRILD